MTICDVCRGMDGGVYACKVDLHVMEEDGTPVSDVDLCLTCRQAVFAAVCEAMDRIKKEQPK